MAAWSRVVRLALLSFAVCLAFPVVAEACSFNISFSTTTSGDLRVRSTATCPGSVDKTYISVSGGGSFGSTWAYGPVAQVIVPYPSSSPAFVCATTHATYWKNGVLWISNEDFRCQAF
jgi:hypothetical protein